MRHTLSSRIVRFFTRIPLPPRAISIEAERVAVAAVKRRKRGRGRASLHIAGAAVEPLPEGVLDPRFSELNVKDRDRLSGAIRRALEKSGLRPGGAWSLAIPRRATQTVVVPLEEVPSSKRELAEILQWKVERLLEVSTSDLRVAFQRLLPLNGQERYLAVAGVEEIIRSYEEALAPLNIRPGLVIPAPLGEASWLWLDELQKDGLLVTCDRGPGDPVPTIVFTRGHELLAVRTAESMVGTLADEIHRTLVYYLDKLAPRSEAAGGSTGAPRPELEAILLIGEAVSREDVEASCRALFPPDRLPSVHAMKEIKLGDDGDVTLDHLASAAGLAAMCLL